MLKIGFYSIYSEKIIQQLKKLLCDDENYKLHCIKILEGEEQVIENGAFTKGLCYNTSPSHWIQ